MGSVLTSLANAAETFRICFPTVLDSLQGHVETQTCDERLGGWAPRVLAHAKVRLDVRGRHHVDPNRAYLLMSNHASFYDIPVLYGAFGGRLRMVAKAELFKVPVFGKAMREAGFVEVDRKDRAKAIESLASAKHLFAGGTSLWISPEGTRTVGGRGHGELGPFKKGGFRVAVDAGLPILPVSLRNTWKIMPPSSVKTQRGVEVVATFQAPIDPNAYLAEERARANGAEGTDSTLPGSAPEKNAIERLMNDVRQAIAKDL